MANTLFKASSHQMEMVSRDRAYASPKAWQFSGLKQAKYGVNNVTREFPSCGSWLQTPVRQKQQWLEQNTLNDNGNKNLLQFWSEIAVEI